MLKKFGSQAIQTASDLEEVQNVVNVSFGSMANEVEAFAKTAIWSFGMSELTAKRTASTFMAMANGMGLAMKDGKNMSLQLTALAGDMASFYNVRQDVAQTALNSIFTGETESLKKFGVVMTEANLSAFCSIKGNYQILFCYVASRKSSIEIPLCIEGYGERARGFCQNLWQLGKPSKSIKGTV